MINLTPSSHKVINTVLATTDVYHCDDFDLKYAVSQYRYFDYETLVNNIRFNTLYGTDGFTTTINQYYSFASRILEFSLYGDQPLALRHKFNMIETLISNDMKTNLPSHFSVKPTFKNETIKLSDLYTRRKEFSSIVHPGFTRFNGAIFLNGNLKNVFIYVNKEHNIVFEKEDCITKIQTKDQLVEYYQPTKKVKDYTIDFFVPDLLKPKLEGVKQHEQTSTNILKANKIKQDVESLHPSTLYSQSTFSSFNKFSRVFFNSRIKIYTNEEYLDEKFCNIENKFGEFLFGDGQKLRDGFVNWNREHYLQLIDPNKTKGMKLTSEEDKFYKSIYKGLVDYSKDNCKYLQEPNFYNPNVSLGNSEVIQINLETINLQDIVTKNNYKGIVVILSENLPNTRLFAELLMITNIDSAVTKTSNETLQIINCEHEFWKTGLNYKETLINNSFFEI